LGPDVVLGAGRLLGDESSEVAAGERVSTVARLLVELDGASYVRASKHSPLVQDGQIEAGGGLSARTGSLVKVDGPRNVLEHTMPGLEQDAQLEAGTGVSVLARQVMG
jgi:hypothetical protein